MSAARKRLGTAFESAVREYLNEGLTDRRHMAFRKAQTGYRDTGDVDAWPFTIEAKNHREINLASFVDQAEREAEAADTPFGAAVVKRRGKGAGAAYVVMSLEQFRKLRAVVLGIEPL
ncbi:hypothetical protein ACIQU6_07475 [Streptomyces sp. NPDC090442]|uniref:hypothetical protein n=1 Tax=Streptomyces sp. NPDC090442 TaxID=3365962 RepID=UPI003810CDB8